MLCCRRGRGTRAYICVVKRRLGDNDVPVKEASLPADDPEGLIRQAFHKARDAGKADWYRMTSAVLKNRLLELTNHAFTERDFGVATFTDFLRKFPDLVRIDRSQLPFGVELIEAAPNEQPAVRSASTGRPRIRRDLWQAAMDFKSGIEYVWDATSARARPRLESDGNNAELLPTSTAEELSQWRKEFIRRRTESENAVVDDKSAVRLQVWAEKGLGTEYLPPEHRGPWNEFMRNAVVDKLNGWFDSRGLARPSDLIETSPQWTEPEADAALSKVLHNLLVRLTRDELSQLQLPATLVLRALYDRKP